MADLSKPQSDEEWEVLAGRCALAFREGWEKSKDGYAYIDASYLVHSPHLASQCIKMGLIRELRPYLNFVIDQRLLNAINVLKLDQWKDDEGKNSPARLPEPKYLLAEDNQITHQGRTLKVDKGGSSGQVL